MHRRSRHLLHFHGFQERHREEVQWSGCRPAQPARKRETPSVQEGQGRQTMTQDRAFRRAEEVRSREPERGARVDLTSAAQLLRRDRFRGACFKAIGLLGRQRETQREERENGRSAFDHERMHSRNARRAI